MAETETNNLPNDLNLEHQKARRHSDIRVFSGTSVPGVVDMEPEEVSSEELCCGVLRYAQLDLTLYVATDRTHQSAGSAWTGHVVTQR